MTVMQSARSILLGCGGVRTAYVIVARPLKLDHELYENSGNLIFLCISSLNMLQSSLVKIVQQADHDAQTRCSPHGQKFS